MFDPISPLTGRTVYVGCFPGTKVPGYMPSSRWDECRADHTLSLGDGFGGDAFSPETEIDQLHGQREGHREIDVALIDVAAGSFNDQHDADQD